MEMITNVSRRCFLKSTAAGVVSAGALAALTERLSAMTPQPALGPKSKVRIGKLYLGREHPGWPSYKADPKADRKDFEAALAKMGPGLADVEFIEGGLIANDQELAAAKEKLKGADGILVIHLTMGIGSQLQSLMELGIPIVVFALPYSGHEWHTMAGWQRQGKLIEVFPSSRHEDVLVAIRPFRAIHRLKEARVLNVNHGPADAAYCQALKEKFGTEIISLKFPDLKASYDAADRSEAMADARRWIKEAKKIVEPTKEEILRSSVMFIGMRDLLAQHQAVAITMNCLGMGLIQNGMGYPCLGFVRLNNIGLGGVCEADLKSTMTHLIFSYLVGKPGFVTDPVFDVSTSTIIHAHCVGATQMLGPGTTASPYHIRSHLEDGKGASLMVKLPVGQKVSMARLLGTDKMLFSTGDAVDSPFVERGCRTKLTVKVNNIDSFLENWSSGLHRVIFYGDHTRDVRRYCRFAQLRLVQEGTDDPQKVDGLDWDPHVHA
jgi:L-fucose isomerase-like protein